MRLRSRDDHRAGLAFDDADLESRLVWIWGSPRSGSSWLLQQLCHPLESGVSAPAGFRAPAGLEPPAGGFDAVPVDESFIPNHLAPAFGNPVEIDGRYVPATLNNYGAYRPGYSFSQAYADVWRPAFRRFALVRLHSIVERARARGIPLADRPALVLKEGNGSHASDQVMSLVPRSRMLFLARDGRDVVDSLAHAYAPGGFFARREQRAWETPEQRREGIRWAARMWACNVDVTTTALNSQPPELRRTVRYEDLLSDTRRELGALLEWLGLERDAAWLDRMVEERSFAAARRRGPHERNRAATPGLWRENLSREEQELVAEIIGPRLAALGYEE